MIAESQLPPASPADAFLHPIASAANRPGISASRSTWLNFHRQTLQGSKSRRLRFSPLPRQTPQADRACRQRAGSCAGRRRRPPVHRVPSPQFCHHHHIIITSSHRRVIVRSASKGPVASEARWGGGVKPSGIYHTLSPSHPVYFPHFPRLSTILFVFPKK